MVLLCRLLDAVVSCTYHLRDWGLGWTSLLIAPLSYCQTSKHSYPPVCSAVAVGVTAEA